MDRRGFLRVASACLSATAFSLNAKGANDRVVVAIMGINDRGMDLAAEFAKMRDVEVGYLADPDSRLFPDRVKELHALSGRKPKCVQDFRRALVVSIRVVRDPQVIIRRPRIGIDLNRFL